MLPAPERLRKANLFQRAYQAKKSISTSLLTLYVLPRHAKSMPRLPLAGFVIGKKTFSKATARNRAKRRVREAYRQFRSSDLKQWYMLVWVIHEKVATAKWSEIQRSVAACTARAFEKYSG